MRPPFLFRNTAEALRRAPRVRRELEARTVEILLEHASRAPHDGNEPFLRPLAEYAEEFLVKIHVAQIEPAELADAQSAAVEHLELGAVTRAGGRSREGLVEQAGRSVDGDKIRQALFLPRKMHHRGGVRLREPLARHERVEALDRGEPALDRGIGVARVATGRREVLDIKALGAVGLLDAALRKKPKVRREISAVCSDGVIGKVSLDGEVDQVLLDGAGKR